MWKLFVIFLFVSINITFSPAAGILGRWKDKFRPQQPQVVDKVSIYVAEQPCKSDRCRPDYVENRPCQSDRCRPDYVENRPCQSSRCNRCHSECYGNERCQNDCIYIERCRLNCNGNDQCMNQCGERVVYDRCTGCATFSDSQQLTNCGPNKMLYYVRVPANITVSEFVSNPDLLKLYNDSNLELDGTGIAGRACLNDKTRLELQNLNATLLQI